ncbi:hypothetical protein FG167_00480 [Lacinutrix sp. WUR7]|uniref:hypothetical protein n=1 Tax=Lacinutrix sp. WUR7 TaxID=2653681 RepID=UPI00193D821A|nr:hypothetical protein [Lacinutrix sp. WUR7]QRM87756.1 hypothetical protein FG167_00480 [Lacinutrix sp. WUR7]
MSVFSKLFGSKQKENKLEDDKYIETIIKSSEDVPLGISNNNLIYVGYNELGGYYYLQTFIIGRLKSKTKEGAKIIIEGNDYTLELNSDMLEFESEPATPLDAYITKIDFEIEKSAVENLKRSTMKQLTLIIKKKEVVFTVKNEE